jgi:hypothetical protein
MRCFRFKVIKQVIWRCVGIARRENADRALLK